MPASTNEKLFQEEKSPSGATGLRKTLKSQKTLPETWVVGKENERGNKDLNLEQVNYKKITTSSKNMQIIKEAIASENNEKTFVKKERENYSLDNDEIEEVGEIEDVEDVKNAGNDSFVFVSKCESGCLKDFICSSGVSVPGILVTCLAEIESRGLETEGLYRVPGNGQLVKHITDRVLAKNPIGKNLSEQDVHVLCDVVKLFFSNLPHPLISEDIQRVLVNTRSANEVYNIIFSWDPPHKDTLAFLVLHLQKVAKSEATKMSAESLASMLAMSLFGTTKKEMELEEILTINKDRRAILETMLNMDCLYWKMILSNYPLCQI